MAKYTNEKLAWAALTNMFGGSKPTPNPALDRINLPAPPKPDSGWSNPLGSLGNWISGAQDTPEVPTKGMLADRAAGTDTASRHAAMRASMPANLPAPKPSESFFSNPLGNIGNWISGAQTTPEVPSAGLLADRAAGTDTASRRNAQMQAGTNVGGGTPIGVGQAAGTNVGGGTPGGVADTWTAPNAGDWLPKGNQSAQQPAMSSKLPKPSVQNPAPSTAGSLRDHPAFKRPGLRNDPMFKDDFDDMAADNNKAQQLRNATGGVGNGTHQGTFRQGQIQPGSTFTPQGGQQGQTPSPKPSNSTLDFYKKQQEQQIASARAQAAALRSAAGVSGPGGGTVSGRVFPDGKGGYRTEGAQFTPQAGYNQNGFKNQPNATSTPSNGVKQSMDKQAIALRANRLHILNTELARYNPANLIKQAADYPTTRNKQACAYYLGLKKQAAVEKKAFLKALLSGLKGAGGLIGSAYSAARPALGTAAENAVRGVRIATKKAPIASLAGAGGLTLAGEHYGLPFLGDVASTVKDRYNESETGVKNFLHRLGRGYSATTADPTADFASSGINKAKKVIESATPKSINNAITNSGIIPSKPSRYLEVEEGSIPAEYKSRSLPRDNPQWRSGTRGRDYSL